MMNQKELQNTILYKVSHRIGRCGLDPWKCCLEVSYKDTELKAQRALRKVWQSLLDTNEHCGIAVKSGISDGSRYAFIEYDDGCREEWKVEGFMPYGGIE